MKKDVRRWLAPAYGMFAVAWGGNEFTPLLVMYKANDGLSQVAVNVLLFAYVLGIVPALLLGGPLSDRYGRRRLMIPAPVIAALGSLVLAVAHGSAGVLFAGRVLSGIALGLVMAAGSAWVKELSGPPFEAARSGDQAVGARRGAMSLTAGFGVGAGVAGALAEWAPLPEVLAFLVNAAVTLPAAVLLRRTPETVTLGSSRRLVDDLKIPAVAHRRFLFVVLPVAPWVFGTAACAYAVFPSLLASKVTAAPVAFSALLCLVGLGCGFAMQSMGRRIDRPGTARGVVVALAAVAGGMALAAGVALERNVLLTVLGALVLGGGFGLSLVGGLTEIERIARPSDLAGLTAVYYSVTYLGFGVPAAMAALAQAAGIRYSAMFLAGAVFALLCLAVVLLHDRRSRITTTADGPAGTPVRRR